MKQTDEKVATTCDLDSLSQANLAKIYGTVMDIEDKLQVNPDSTVEIDWYFRNRPKVIEDLDRLECRMDALTFLQNWGAISSHNCNRLTPMTGESISVSVNIQEFQKFKQKISEVYKAKETRRTPANSSSALTTKRRPAHEDTDVVYEIKLTTSREILLNNLVLARPEFGSENEIVFRYLFDNPNRTVTLDELQKRMGDQPIKKTLHKIVENLGFQGDLKDAFFSVAKDSILFRNPIRKEDMKKLGKDWLRIPRT